MISNDLINTPQNSETLSMTYNYLNKYKIYKHFWTTSVHYRKFSLEYHLFHFMKKVHGKN